MRMADHMVRQNCSKTRRKFDKMNNLDKLKTKCGQLIVESNLPKDKKFALLDIVEHEKSIKKLKIYEEKLKDKIKGYYYRQTLMYKFIMPNISNVIKLDQIKCNSGCRNLNKLEMRLCLHQCKLARKEAEYKLIKDNYQSICIRSKTPSKCRQRGLKKVYTLQKQINILQGVINYLNSKIQNQGIKDSDSAEYQGYYD
jgi:hypothetical protein